MQNMSRLLKSLVGAALLLVLVSCGQNARIDGVLEGVPSSEVVVKLLDINKYQVADTLKTGAQGEFSCKVNIQKGDPEFVYLYHNDKKIASLLLQAGDKVTVKADTLGNWTVEGSESSSKLAEVEAGYAAVVSRMYEISLDIQTAEGAELKRLREELTKEYITYYRECVEYIMKNSKSLTSVPVLFYSLGDGLPVFGQITDGIHFSNVADSLETVYPHSKYVKALRQEAEKRMTYLEIDAKLATAEQVDYLDIELPDVKAQKVKLSEVKGKVTLVYFWSAADAAQKMFNLDVLAPVYKEFHSKGFEIYQVSLDTDKGLWAKVVREQGLDWTNVCDSRGAASPFAASYNISRLPSAFIIGAQGLENAKITDAASLRKLVAKSLK